MFCEVDRGTESQKIWTKKIDLYLKLATSGEFRTVCSAEPLPCAGDRRLRTAPVAVRKTVAQQTSKVFWFSTLKAINREGLFASHWLRPVGDGRFSLL